MAKPPSSPERREDALSRERIVDAAIEILDADGEDGLTFRALASRLATGPGALYWHIENKSELLIAASDAVIARALAKVRARKQPREAIRGIAACVFDAIDAHYWVGVQLSRTPWQTAALQIFDRLGSQVQALGVVGRAQFTTASALLGYVIGVSTQNAINAHRHDPSVDRADFLEALSARLDAKEYPFLHEVAAQLREHDDRVEFLAGMDLILSGVSIAR